MKKYNSPKLVITAFNTMDKTNGLNYLSEIQAPVTRGTSKVSVDNLKS